MVTVQTKTQVDDSGHAANISPTPKVHNQAYDSMKAKKFSTEVTNHKYCFSVDEKNVCGATSIFVE